MGKARRGLTVVEIVVVLAILGLLAALLLPAVQQARGASRRMVCQSHIRQFGIALAGFAETHRAFPTTQLPEPAYWRLLPYFEQRNLLELLRGLQASQVPGGQFPQSCYVEVLGCPDDPVVQTTMEVGNTSYFYNAGTRFRTGPLNGFIRSALKDTKPEEITDGLSQTVAMSERLVYAFPGSPGGGYRPNPEESRRHFWWTQVRYSQPGEEPLAVEQCRNHRTTTFPQYVGVHALNLNTGSGGYDHMLPPNHHGCYNGPEDFGADWSLSLRPASSNHPGGVNSLMGDGSVHFVGESIDAGVWSALGTRNGGESVALPF